MSNQITEEKEPEWHQASHQAWLVQGFLIVSLLKHWTLQTGMLIHFGTSWSTDWQSACLAPVTRIRLVTSHTHNTRNWLIRSCHGRRVAEDHFQGLDRFSGLETPSNPFFGHYVKSCFSHDWVSKICCHSRRMWGRLGRVHESVRPCTTCWLSAHFARHCEIANISQLHHSILHYTAVVVIVGQSFYALTSPSCTPIQSCTP